MGRLMGTLLLFVVFAAPFVMYAWHTLSELLAGRFRPDHTLAAALAVAVLAILLRLIARYLSRLEEAAG